MRSICISSRNLTRQFNHINNHNIASLNFCTETISTKEGAGTIQSIFNETEEGTEELRNKNAALKNELQNKIYSSTLGNKMKLQHTWDELKLSLESEYEYIDKNRNNMIPIIDMKRISNCSSLSDLSSSFIGDTIRKVGVFIVTNVIDKHLINEYNDELKQYIDLNTKTNGYKLHGSPPHNPQVYEIYWSKSQIKARQHPNMIKAIRFANNLWSFNNNNNNNNTVDIPCMYVDRLRIREPLDESFNFLTSHLDSGSIERWEDINYRKCYDNIFKLNWKEYNGYDATNRINAKMDLYNTENCCTAFRSFQGWLAMSNIKTGNGTLKVSPILKESTAYIMLRPFIKDENNKYLQEWNFGEIWGKYGLKLKDKYHKILIDSMVSIPNVNAGDMVFWHCDTIHAVEQKNNSNIDYSNVFYIPACFDCHLNHTFMKLQKQTFLNGTSPPDFPQTNSELNWENRATIHDLDDLGKMIMHI
eukprot:265572_1